MFLNRKDAGEKLGRALERYRHQGVLVLGIPRGGVETACYVADYLDAELSVVIARKLGYPVNPEAAFGAVAEDGSLYLDAAAREYLTDEQIQKVLEDQQKEIQRRVERFRHGKPLPAMKGRTVIVVDDGIATGATLFATIKLCKKSKAGSLVVAALISGSAMEHTLQELVDDVVILEKPTDYNAVSQGYEEFNNLTDEEALSLLERWQELHRKSPGK